MAIEEILFFILLIILIIMNIFICITYRKKNDNEYEKAIYTLNNIINMYRLNYQRVLNNLAKKHQILRSDGSVTPPNDSIPKYRETKEKVKALWGKKVLTSMNIKTRKVFLKYYSNKGFVNYILSELDREV